MATRVRSFLPKRWRDALRPDVHLASAEGLAAGTGLLTGDVARAAVSQRLVQAPCPRCRSLDPEVLVVDLVARSTTLRCRSCGHGWHTEDLPRTSTGRADSS